MIKHSQSSQNSNFANFLQYLKKEVRDEVDFLHANKLQNFLQIDFNTFDIKVSYNVILLLLVDVIKHSRSTQSKKFSTIKSQGWSSFLHAGKHQSFCKLVLSFLMEVARDVQITQSTSLVV